MRHATLGVVAVLSMPASLPAQDGAPIRDNSFLIEEAYNQDRNVVQHIGVFTSGPEDGWAFNFTDEWPVGGLRDQLSVGATLLETGAGAGFGGLALNYRRQLVGHPEAAVIMSPRLSLIAAFGDSAEGGLAVQANIPVTAVLADALVSHWNLGATVGVGPTILNAGGSVVWLAAPWMNFLVEGLFLGIEGETPGYVLSPGVRWAANIGTVQVVPGVAVPFNLGRRGGNELLFYLSIEHPFGPTD
ncbi:MAG TPA: hypothetical protein VFV65_07385 [Gemmatimonadales bacterium]|nr:hypothetical protein [Gemmatimonadales bacterium]